MSISNEAKFGIFALIAIVLIIFGLRFMSGSKFFGPPLTLYAKYNTVEGLIKGNPILINGLQVGRVGELTLDMNEGLATATLNFDDDLDIPENAEAMIYSVDLLGSKGVQIWVPDSLIPSNTYLRDGAEIKGTLETGIFDAASDLVQNQGAKILLEVAKLSVELNEIVTLTKQLLVDQNNQNTFRATLDNIRETTENLANISGEVDSLSRQINKATGSVVSIVENVEKNNDDISGIIHNVRTTTDSLVTASTEIKQLMTDASSAVGSVESMVAKLDTTSGTLGLLLNDTQLYDSLASTTENINALLREVKQNPQRFFDDIKIYLIERKPPKQKARKE